MGGQCSKSTKADASTPIPINDISRYRADLSSYEAACRTDPDLQSFDAIIHERTTRALTSLPHVVETGSVTFDALFSAIDSQQEINQDVVEFFLKYNEDVWKNKEMFKLVEKYFDNTQKTFEFCDALQSCLRKIRDSKMILGHAVKQFKEEVKNGGEGKYEKTLEELRKFKEAGDPITEEFVKLFQHVYEHHLSFLNDLQEEKRKLDKKLKSYKTWKKVSNVIFIAAFASILILSVVAAAFAAGPVVAAVAAAATAVPMASVGKWCNTLWNRYIKELKGQKKLLSSLQDRTRIVLWEFQTICPLVCRLEEIIFSMSENSKFALREEDHAVKLVIEEIEKKLEEFNQTINRLFQHADKCRQDVMMARTLILQHIAGQLDKDDDNPIDCLS